MVKMHIKFNQLLFEITYIYLIGLYIFFLRLNAVPSSLTNLLYGFSIVLAFVVLSKQGFYKLSNRADVQAILFFLFYYMSSSLLFLAFGNLPELSWFIKDWLYALLPILFYIYIRQTKIVLNPQHILKITLVAITIYDVIAIIMLLFPRAGILYYFNQDALVNDSVSYSLFGILGSILGGFTSVIALAICMLSPIQIRPIIKILLSVFFVVIIFMVGQRTPIVGVVIVSFISLIKQRGRNLWLPLGFIVLLFVVFSFMNIEVEGISIKGAMTERYLNRFEIFASGRDNRDVQWQLFNMDTMVGLVFGNGVGRYSQENPYSIVAMSDAMMFRIFNEMGILGLFSYLYFFVLNFIRAVKCKNNFMIAFISYAFFANCFNRVLFTAPMSIIPYVIIAIFNWHTTNHTTNATFLRAKM